MDIFNVKNPIFPLCGIIISVITLFFGIFTARLEHIYIFYILLYILYLCFGYYKACLGIIPLTIFMVTIFAGLTYLTGQNIDNTMHAVNRSLAVTFAIIPGMSVSTTHFIRNLQMIKVPKIITLGLMIAANFFPLLYKEMKQIKDAMKTRGVNMLFNPKVLYRAFLVPLVVRMVNISDTLAISVETRGFTIDKSNVTVYKPLKFKFKDGLFCVIFLTLCIVSVIICVKQ